MVQVCLGRPGISSTGAETHYDRSQRSGVGAYAGGGGGLGPQWLHDSPQVTIL